MNDNTKLQQLFHVLRLSGAAMIVAAAGTFLVQSWDQTEDVTRYLALLAMTGLLPGVAYLCGIRFREGRSARVLVLTFLALVPIHAGVLGGFVLSQFGDTSAALGPVAQWVAPTRGGAIALVAGASAVLVPLTWGAYRVLARPHAGLLTAASAGVHALLLVPDRSVHAATLAVIPVLLTTCWCGFRIKPETRESKLAVAFLLGPAIVLAARQVFFYEVTSAFWSVILGACAIGLFLMGRKSGDTSVERLAIIPTMLASAALLIDFAPLQHVSPAITCLAYGWATAVAWVAFASSSERSSGFFIRAAVTMNAFTTAATLIAAPGPLPALQAIAIGIGLLSYGFIRGRRLALHSGIGLAGFGFIVEVSHAIETFEASGWLALAASGVVLVALSAWLERRARAVRLADPLAKVSEPAPATLS